MFDNLTSENAILYAAHVYDNPQCVSWAEFEEDYRRIKYVKRLIHRYHQSGQLKERLLLNHVILLANVFPPPSLARLLFVKLDPSHYSTLRTLLEFLSLAPARVTGIKGQVLLLSDFPVNIPLRQRLEQL
jgi:hypothetical protein